MLCEHHGQEFHLIDGHDAANMEASVAVLAAIAEGGKQGFKGPALVDYVERELNRYDQFLRGEQTVEQSRLRSQTRSRITEVKKPHDFTVIAPKDHLLSLGEKTFPTARDPIPSITRRIEETCRKHVQDLRVLATLIHVTDFHRNAHDPLLLRLHDFGTRMQQELSKNRDALYLVLVDASEIAEHAMVLSEAVSPALLGVTPDGEPLENHDAKARSLILIPTNSKGKDSLTQRLRRGVQLATSKAFAGHAGVLSGDYFCPLSGIRVSGMKVRSDITEIGKWHGGSWLRSTERRNRLNFPFGSDEFRAFNLETRTHSFSLDGRTEDDLIAEARIYPTTPLDQEAESFRPSQVAFTGCSKLSRDMEAALECFDRNNVTTVVACRNAVHSVFKLREPVAIHQTGTKGNIIAIETGLEARALIATATASLSPEPRDRAGDVMLNLYKYMQDGNSSSS
jgi:hypothetical protein